MEQAEHRPHLANPHESKKLMGKPNKHDALDAGGLGILLHNGTLPEAWIPPGELRDIRELLRTRMSLRDHRTALKHRIHAAIDRYGLHNDAISDLFGKAGREFLLHQLTGLPPETRSMLLLQLQIMNDLEPRIAAVEDRIAVRIQPTPEVQLLMTIPGVGEILSPCCGWRSATSNVSHAQRIWPATPDSCPAYFPAAATLLTATPIATSTAICAGASSRPRLVPSTITPTTTVTSACSFNVCF